MEILNGKLNPDLAAQSVLGAEPSSLQPMCTVKHSITRYRITLEAFAVRLKQSARKNGSFWKTPAQIRELAFSSAHKKLASAAIDCILSDR